MARVAVAVVSWNTRELLRRCLESLRPDAESGLAEVWVVDNGSEDGSPDLVRSDFGWATLHEPGGNLGFGRAVNAVAERTDSEWIAPSNADIAVEPGALGALLEAGRSGERVGAVAPRLILPDGATQHSVHPFPTVSLSLAFGVGLHRIVPGLADRLALEGGWNAERAREVDWAHGAFLLVRRSAWREVGGFDPAQWMYAEDLDLGWRLAKTGWTTRYEPRARVRHEHAAAASVAFGNERHDRYMEASYGWMARRRGMAVTWTFAGLNYAIAQSRAAAFGLGARFAPRRFSGRRDAARAHAAGHRRGLRSRARLLQVR
jgi:GT2 family glycosyltransferase